MDMKIYKYYCRWALDLIERRPFIAFYTLFIIGCFPGLVLPLLIDQVGVPILSTIGNLFAFIVAIMLYGRFYPDFYKAFKTMGKPF